MNDITQRSPEWFAIRVGKVTASRVADVGARTKSGFGASRANYMAELIAERLTGEPAERFSNAAMQWGTDKEPEARTAYEFETNTEVVEVGFAAHPSIPMSGASPDGLVGTDGLVEIKCPNTATHIDTLLSGTIPDKYVTQMLWQMACTGREWCDFVSFDPRMPENMRLFVRRIERDADRIGAHEKDVREFLGELDAKVAALVSTYGSPSAVRAA
jgi:putative phage-type endonuclease